MDTLMSIMWTISLIVALMPALAICLCVLRFYPIHFVPYAHRLWLTLIMYFGFIQNNNRFTFFKNGFLGAKGIPIARIGFNDVFDFAHIVYILIWADVDMGTHCDDVGAQISIGFKNSTLTITFVQYNRPHFSSSLCDMIEQLLNINFCLFDIVSFNMIHRSFNLIFSKGIQQPLAIVSTNTVFCSGLHTSSHKIMNQYVVCYLNQGCTQVGLGRVWLNPLPNPIKNFQVGLGWVCEFFFLHIRPNPT